MSVLTAMSRILVLGSLNMDLVVTLPRLPTPGETVIGDALQKVPGGKGANQALAAARLGGEVALVGRVGADEFGATIVEGLADEHVDVSGVSRDPSEPTGVALIEVDAAGQNSIAVAPGANGRVGPVEVRRMLDRLHRGDVLLLQQEVPEEAVQEAARRARDLGARVVLNAAPRRGARPELLPSIDILIVNETEVQDFAGRAAHDMETAVAAASAVVAMGVPAVVVTLGAAGAIVRKGSETFPVQAFQVDPVDTTAAGDAFVGALAAALAEGKELRGAARLGAAAGAVAATKRGAQPSLPRRRDLHERFGLDWSSI